MARALDAFEAEAARFGDTVDIGTIAVACALGYVDFRYDADGWRSTRPKLAAWYEDFSKRPSIASTAPPEGRWPRVDGPGPALAMSALIDDPLVRGIALPFLAALLAPPEG